MRWFLSPLIPAFALVPALLLAFIILLAPAAPLVAENYTPATLPSHISVNGTRSDTLTPDRGNYQATVIKAPQLTIQGTGKYSLSITDPAGLTAGASTFYSQGFHIQGVQVQISNLHTLAIQSNGISLQNASLDIQGSHKPISPSGTDFGGHSKVRSKSLITLKNSQASFSGFHFFIQEGATMIDTNSTLRIKADTIRLQNKGQDRFQNNGGSVVLEGSVYNIGSPICLDNACVNEQNSIAILESQGGKISVLGDFHNGGQAIVDGGSILDVFDPPFGGGGSMLLRGSSMEVIGDLISKRGGRMTIDGDLIDPRDSSLTLYGATLRAKNIKTSSQITLGAHQDKLSKITATNFENTGDITIDLSGFTRSGKYQLIDSSITTNANITIKNGNSEFMSTKLLTNSANSSPELWNGWIEINFQAPSPPTPNPHPPMPSPTPPQPAPKPHFTANEWAILEALGKEVLGVEGMSTQEFKNASKTIESSLITQFFSPLETLTLLEGRPNLELPCHPRSFGLGLLQGGILGRIGGGLGGLEAQVDFALPDCTHISLDLAYAYANTFSTSAHTRIATIHSQLSSHLLALGSRIHGSPLPHLALSLKLAYLTSLGELQGSIVKSNHITPFASPSYFHRFILDARASYALPYHLSLGLELKQSYNAIPRFQNGGALAWMGEYGAYQLSLPMELGFDYAFGDRGLRLDLEFEQFLIKGSDLRLQNTQGSPLKLQAPLAQRIKLQASLKFSLPAFLFGLDARYQASFSSLDPIHFLGAGAWFVF